MTEPDHFVWHDVAALIDKPKLQSQTLYFEGMEITGTNYPSQIIFTETWNPPSIWDRIREWVR